VGSGEAGIGKSALLDYVARAHGWREVAQTALDFVKRFA
jgi:hypothetical protein